MIEINEVQLQKPVLYQQRYMRNPEHGIIVGIDNLPLHVLVLLAGDKKPRLCSCADLFWPISSNKGPS